LLLAPADGVVVVREGVVMAGAVGIVALYGLDVAVGIVGVLAAVAVGLGPTFVLASCKLAAAIVPWPALEIPRFASPRERGYRSALAGAIQCMSIVVLRCNLWPLKGLSGRP
jgi:hypothetical protein